MTSTADGRPSGFHEAGQHPAVHASTTPDRVAVTIEPGPGSRTYGELDRRSRQVAGLLRARGLRTGDHLAVLLRNQVEFFDVVWGGLRAGLYVTPISSHLTGDEATYVLADSGATALVASADLADVVAGLGPDLDRVATRLAVDGDLPGFERLDDALATVLDESAPSDGTAPVAGRAGAPATRCDGEAITAADGRSETEAETEAGDIEVGDVDGTWMFYSSGTTGRPKGILPALPTAPLGAPSPFTMLLTGLYGFEADSVYLCPAPLYHAAPAGWTTGTQRLGGTVVVMEHFDPVDLLAQVERHRVTHLQVVPTHLIRLLKLPAEVRSAYDLSSLRVVVHAAAPCPVEVKRQVIEWLGPIVYEYYSGSEGSGFCAIGPEEWLAHPGSVGRSLLGAAHIVGSDGEEVPAGTEGAVWFETPHRWEYHDDPDKTAESWDTRGWSTLGDIGHLDAEGYLYLTDRASNMIITGGVNVYPREVEDLLVLHPAVADVAVLGTPHDDLGEQVTAFVEPVPDGPAPSPELARELVDHCRERLSHVKCPREVRFVDALPRMPNGKLLKRLLV